MEVDLLKVLVRGRMISVKGKSLWIPFKYEKLTRICFDCGRISHHGGGCPRWFYEETRWKGAIWILA